MVVAVICARTPLLESFVCVGIVGAIAEET